MSLFKFAASVVIALSGLCMLSGIFGSMMDDVAKPVSNCITSVSTCDTKKIDRGLTSMEKQSSSMLDSFGLGF